MSQVITSYVDLAIPELIQSDGLKNNIFGKFTVFGSGDNVGRRALTIYHTGIQIMVARTKVLDLMFCSAISIASHSVQCVIPVIVLLGGIHELCYPYLQHKTLFWWFIPISRTIAWHAKSPSDTIYGPPDTSIDLKAFDDSRFDGKMRISNL